MTRIVPLRSVPVGEAFVFADKPDVYEHHGNGSYSLYGHATLWPSYIDGDTEVTIEASVPHPSQSLSCFL